MKPFDVNIKLITPPYQNSIIVKASKEEMQRIEGLKKDDEAGFTMQQSIILPASCTPAEVDEYIACEIIASHDDNVSKLAVIHRDKLGKMIPVKDCDTKEISILFSVDICDVFLIME